MRWWSSHLVIRWRCREVNIHNACGDRWGHPQTTTTLPVLKNAQSVRNSVGNWTESFFGGMDDLSNSVFSLLRVKPLFQRFNAYLVQMELPNSFGCVDDLSNSLFSASQTSSSVSTFQCLPPDGDSKARARAHCIDWCIKDELLESYPRRCPNFHVVSF